MRHVYQDQTIGGADILNSLADVNINNPEDGQMLVYDASTQRWRNVTQKSLNDLAEVTDLTNIIATGTTNATGGTITKGKFFYLNDDLCQAKADIASGATFTLNTNYEEVTAGGLNALNSNIAEFAYNNLSTTAVNLIPYNSDNNQYTCPSDGYVQVQDANGSSSVTAVISGADGLAAVSINAMSYGIHAIAVRKGMKVRIGSSGTLPRASFRAFTS